MYSALHRRNMSEKPSGGELQLFSVRQPLSILELGVGSGREAGREGPQQYQLPSPSPAFVRHDSGEPSSAQLLAWLMSSLSSGFNMNGTSRGTVPDLPLQNRCRCHSGSVQFFSESPPTVCSTYLCSSLLTVFDPLAQQRCRGRMRTQSMICFPRCGIYTMIYSRNTC